MVLELRLTKTEQRMFDVLSDGMPHSGDELRACFNDDMGCESLLSAHLSHLRDKLMARGLNVALYKGHYLLMRRINSTE